MDATKEAGYEITESEEKVRFPRRPFVRSGYVVLPKGSSKTIILTKFHKACFKKSNKQNKMNSSL